MNSATTYAADAALRRSRILAATLTHVPFDGWTWKSVALGAKDAGYAEAEAHLAFPEGIREVVTAYSVKLDRRMQAALDARAVELGGFKTRERVAFALRVRLEGASSEREAVRRLVAFLALPENCGLGAKLLWSTVDAIWRAAGDRSTDFNFYTKRGLLAGVVGATVLYWLADESEGYADTWAFLDRRIDEVMRVGSLPHRVSGWFDDQLKKVAGGDLFRRGGERPWASRWPGRRRPSAPAGHPSVDDPSPIQPDEDGLRL
jgi:ubiquinone biosynthesis protein COQ9